MNIYEKKCVGFCLLSIFVLMASASSAHANRGSEEPVGAPNNETSETFLAEAVQENSEPRFTVMLDKLHSVADALTVKHPVHYYGFVSRRGQDVLLYAPVGDPVTNEWKTEYYENGEWVTQTLETKVFTNLTPEAEVIVRITPRNPLVASTLPYTVRFGSYPVLKSYELLDEPGVIRIPSGYTNPDWLATQVYKEAVFEARFTDTKGSSLEGGMAILDLSFGQQEPSIEHIAVSDANGYASQRIEFGRCYGGVQAQDFVHKQRGFNTWRSHYKVAGYTVHNFSLGPMTATPRIFFMGHICTQTVLRTVAPRG